MKIEITKEFGLCEYELIGLANNTGMFIILSTCGASIREIYVPDKFAETKLVTLAAVDPTIFHEKFNGKIVGRTAGRINNATFTLNGKTALLEKNNSDTDNLHGGETGFHKQIFNKEIIDYDNYTDVIFTYFSPDGEGGYFADVNVTVTYRVHENKNSFEIIINGKTNEVALLNVTNHVHWNLSGDLVDDVLEHDLYLNSSSRGLLNNRLIVEKFIPVTEMFNFKNEKKIGKYINEPSVIEHTAGYDHPFKLDEVGLDKVAAVLSCKESGITLEMSTTYPYIVVYTNNFPVDTLVYDDVYDGEQMAVCLECQYHPDGINQEPNNCGVFDSTNDYCEVIKYSFI